MEQRWAALLRGVNVGGKNILPMKDLAQLVAGLGGTNVTTLIQSGNVAFSGSESVAGSVRDRLTAAIAERLGHAPPVVLRSGAQLAAVLEANPFASVGTDALHVGFLRDAPPADARLDPNRSPGDTFRIVGSDVYLHLPNGVARTKLTSAFFDRGLQTVITVRNWRTVEKLAALCA